MSIVDLLSLKLLCFPCIRTLMFRYNELAITLLCYLLIVHSATLCYELLTDVWKI